MRDLKKINAKTSKVRQNRRKQERKPLNLRRILRRVLHVGVALFSLALVGVCGFLGIEFLMTSDTFRVEEVIVSGTERLERQHIAALSDIQRGMNSFDLDLDLIGRKIEGDPWVRSASVRRIFPRQMVIEIQERQPVAVVNLGYLYYLDDHGEIFKVLENGDKLDYPLVSGFDYERAQQHDSEYAELLERIVELIGDLKERELFNLDQVSEIHLEADGGLALFTLEGGVRIKIGSRDFAGKIDRLERIYAKLQPQLKALDYIDLNVAEKIIVRIERSDRTTKS
ncbi:MAG: cell division protein FtsQ [Desulfuromonas sp.]|nr:MAG: cell division protein FtsQ [Desulfuromonas sp.]